MNQGEWYTLYSDALVEHDLKRLPDRIRDAESAIFSRIQTLARDSNADAERQSLATALSSLRALQRNLLRYPREKQQIA